MKYTLRQLRTNSGFNQTEVCEAVGMKIKELQNAEHRGIQKKFRDSVLPKLADLYDVSLKDIRIANMISSNSGQENSVPDIDEQINKIDLRKIFRSLHDFDQPVTINHLKDILQRTLVVDGLVSIDYKATMESILTENSDSGPPV